MSDKSNIEATIRTLRKNIAQAAKWYGEDDHRVNRIREFLADSEQHLADLNRKGRSATIV